MQFSLCLLLRKFLPALWEKCSVKDRAAELDGPAGSIQRPFDPDTSSPNAPLISMGPVEVSCPYEELGIQNPLRVWLGFHGWVHLFPPPPVLPIASLLYLRG